MSRVVVFLVTVLLAVVVLSVLPGAQATHEWGHRYMIYGRILDVDGDPLQRQSVRITVETTKAQDPYMTVRTDCQGLYYSLKEPANAAEDFGLEAGVMHIHKWELPSDARYTVTTEFGSKSGKVRPEMHRSTVNFQVDSDVPEVPECSGAPDWSVSYVVQGRVQEIDGSDRIDKMTQRGIEFNVTVTIETASGTETGHSLTNRFGDYMVMFDNVSVADGDKVKASWDGHTETSRVDTEFRVSEANLVYGGGFASGAAKVLLWVVGGIVLVGLVVWGGGKLRAQMESSRLGRSSGRKRANR